MFFLVSVMISVSLDSFGNGVIRDWFWENENKKSYYVLKQNDIISGMKMREIFEFVNVRINVSHDGKKMNSCQIHRYNFFPPVL